MEIRNHLWMNEILLRPCANLSGDDVATYEQRLWTMNALPRLQTHTVTCWTNDSLWGPQEVVNPSRLRTPATVSERCWYKQGTLESADGCWWFWINAASSPATPWWLGKWRARCSPLCIWSWSLSAFCFPEPSSLQTSRQSACLRLWTKSHTHMHQHAEHFKYLIDWQTQWWSSPDETWPSWEVLRPECRSLLFLPWAAIHPQTPPEKVQLW